MGVQIRVSPVLSDFSRIRCPLFVVNLVLARGVSFLSLSSLICPWVLRNSFNVFVYWSGTLGQNLTCLGIFFAFCLIKDIAWTLEKVHIRKWVLVLSLPLFASKTEMGVIFASSSVFKLMGFSILLMKISLGCIFEVWGFFQGILKTS